MENTNVTEQSTNEIMPMAASGETNFASLPEKATPASGDMFLMEDSEDTKKINYDKLADAILNKLTSKTYSGLETTAKNFVTAINELNSKSKSGCAIRATIANDNLQTDEDIRQYIYDNYRNSSYVAAFGISSDVNTSHNVPARAGGFMLAYFPTISGYALIVYFTYAQTTYISIMQDDVWGDWR